MIHMRYLAALSALPFCLVAPVHAQTAAPTYLEGNQVKAAGGMFVVDKSGTPFGTSTNPIYVSCIAATCSGGSGGVGGSGGAVAQAGAWANSIISGTNTLSINSSGQAFVYDANTAMLAASINSPIPANTAGTYIGDTVLRGQAGASTSAVPITGASVAINVSAATTTQLVAGVAGQQIRITHWDVAVASAQTVQFVYGTGTNCSTGTTGLTGAYPFAANGGMQVGTGVGAELILPTGASLCIVTGGAVQTSGSAAYAIY